jgi:hypothetical protein
MGPAAILHCADRRHLMTLADEFAYAVSNPCDLAARIAAARLAGAVLALTKTQLSNQSDGGPGFGAAPCGAGVLFVARCDSGASEIFEMPIWRRTVAGSLPRRGVGCCVPLHPFEAAS